MKRYAWELLVVLGLLLMSGGLALASVPLALLFAGGSAAAIGVLGSVHQALAAAAAERKAAVEKAQREAK